MKRKSLLLTVVAMIGLTTATMAQTVPNYVPTNGLVGWWPFNGNANDESGNGNNGTVNGATLTTDRFGNANKAYSFDGVDDKITVNHNQSLNCLPITINCWIYLNDFPQESGIINKYFNQSTNGYGISIIDGTEGQKIHPFYFKDFNNNIVEGNGQGYIDFDDVFNNSSWRNIIFTVNSIKGELFIDGIKKTDLNWQGLNGLTTSLSNLYFGWYENPGNVPNTTGYFKGKIDDIGIWNRALTECEIQDLYNAQLGSFSNTAVTINPTNAAIGSNAILSVSSPISSLQWQSNPSNVGWVNLSNNTQYNGVTNDTLVVSNLQLSNHNQPFRVLACGDTSNIATIQIADTCITNVTIYDTLLTTVTDTLIINTTLSLPAPNNQNTILIYPNPASDHITIDNGNYTAMAGYTIKIENNAGQQVFQSAVNQPQFYIDLSTWSGNGLYFVHLIDPQNNTVTVRKIVLQ
jgi:hypothetical protein